jgi:hypothetical protein
VAAQIVLPDINEVPADFPATVLWKFRMASLGMQAMTWSTIGLVFGALAERSLGRSRRAHAGAVLGRRASDLRHGIRHRHYLSPCSRHSRWVRARLR